MFAVPFVHLFWMVEAESETETQREHRTTADKKNRIWLMCVSPGLNKSSYSMPCRRFYSSFFLVFFLFIFILLNFRTFRRLIFCNNVFQLWILINYLYSISMILFALLGPICQLIFSHFVSEPIMKVWKYAPFDWIQKLHTELMFRNGFYWMDFPGQR